MDGSENGGAGGNDRSRGKRVTPRQVLAVAGAVPPPHPTSVELLHHLAEDQLERTWLAATLETSPRLEARVLRTLRQAIPGLVDVADGIDRLGLDVAVQRTLEVTLLDHAVQLGSLLTGLLGRARWEHAMATAGAARQLAAARHDSAVAPPLAFAAGALRRAGVAVLESHLRTNDPSTGERLASGRMSVAQCERMLDVDTAHLGRLLLRVWGVPPLIRLAVAPPNGSPRTPLGCLLQEAAMCAQAAGFPAEAWSKRTVNTALTPELVPTIDAATRQVEWCEKLRATSGKPQSSPRSVTT